LITVVVPKVALWQSHGGIPTADVQAVSAKPTVGWPSPVQTNVLGREVSMQTRWALVSVPTGYRSTLHAMQDSAAVPV